LKREQEKLPLNEEKKKSSEISRRDFLMGAGTVVAGGIIGSGLLSGCKPETVTTTVEIPTTKSVTKTVEVPTTVVSTVQGPVSTVTTTKTVGETGGETTVTTTVTEGGYSFEIPPEPIPDSQIKQTYTAEIIVVGAGTSGMVTAKSAVEHGADVMVVTASSFAVSRGGSNHGVNTKTTIEQGISYDVRRAFKQEMDRSGGRINQQLWYKFFNNSPESMNWLVDKMEAAGYTTVIEYAPPEPDDIISAYPGSHCFLGEGVTRAGIGQPFVMQLLTDELEASGTPIHWKTVAKQLVRTNNNTGRVTAVIAQNEAGEYVKYIGTKAIVLATGDFTVDKEMVSKYCPEVLALTRDADVVDYDMCFPPAGGGGIYKGDGHKMALWVGAAWQRNIPNAPMLEGGIGPAAESYGNFKGLILNKYGERICSEDMTKTQTTYLHLNQPEQKIYAIWDIDYAEHMKPWMPFGSYFGGPEQSVESVIAGWDRNVERGSDSLLEQGKFVKADTIEEVAEQLGLDPEAVRATVDRYNQLCDDGFDEDFLKRADYLKAIRNPPFYGQFSPKPMIHIVTGGIRTNAKLQALDENDTPIPGLYMAGTIIGDFFAGYYSFMPSGINLGALCVTLPYVLGKELAES